MPTCRIADCQSASLTQLGDRRFSLTACLKSRRERDRCRSEFRVYAARGTGRPKQAELQAWAFKHRDDGVVIGRARHAVFAAGLVNPVPILLLVNALERGVRLWEFPNMNAVKVDAAKRIRLPRLRPGDYYEPDYLGPEEIRLRRVPERKRKGPITKAQALAALARSRLRFSVSWDELRQETRS